MERLTNKAIKLKWTVVLLLLTGHCCTAQDWKWGIPLTVDAGLSLANLDEQGLNMDQVPGATVALRSGFSATYRERVRLTAEGGGFLSAYNFQKALSAYSVAMVDPRVQMNLAFFSNEINKHGSRFFVGLGGGFTFWSSDEASSSTDDFDVSVSKSTKRLGFINPEIGLTKMMSNGQMDLLLTYLHHLGDDRNVQINFSSDVGSARAESAANYFGLRVRYTFSVMQGEKENPIVKSPPAQIIAGFEERKTEDLASIKTKSRKASITVFDNADVDGDIISIALNGEYLLSGYRLTKEKHKIKFTLDAGLNEIAIYAHNEGDVSPNTSTCVLKTGMKSRDLLVTTSMKRNQRILVVLE